MTVNLTIPTTFEVLPVTSISGWIVIHSRYSAAYQVDMTWNDYVTGFGDASSSDFWLGLEYIHLLTTSATNRLRVEIQTADDGKYDQLFCRLHNRLCFNGAFCV